MPSEPLVSSPAIFSPESNCTRAPATALPLSSTRRRKNPVGSTLVIKRNFSSVSAAIAAVFDCGAKPLAVMTMVICCPNESFCGSTVPASPVSRENRRLFVAASKTVALAPLMGLPSTPTSSNTPIYKIPFFSSPDCKSVIFCCGTSLCPTLTSKLSPVNPSASALSVYLALGSTMKLAVFPSLSSTRFPSSS